MKQFLTSFLHFAPDNGSGMHRLWTDNGPMKSRKLFALLFTLLFIGVGQMWGADVDSGTSQFTTVSGDLDTYISYASAQAGGSTTPIVYSSNIRLYRNNSSSAALGSTLTVSASGGARITDITFTLSATRGYSISVDGGAATTGSASSISKSSINATSVTLQNYSASQMDVRRIQVTYTVPTPCTITWHVNGGTTTAGSPTVNSTTGSKVSQLPTAPLSAACDGSKVFVGWTETAIVGTMNTKPSDLFINAAGAPTLTQTATHYYAVFADEDEEEVSKTFEFTISYSDFNQTSYAANDGSHSSTATATDASGATMTVDWTSSNVMRGTGGNSSKIQFRSTPGYIYNTTDLNSIGSVTVTSGSNVATFQNRTENPTSNGTPKKYFRVARSSGTGYASSITVNFTKTTTVTTYSAYATSCCTALGTINGSVSLSQLATPNPTKLKATWTMNAETGIDSYDLEVYDNSDNLIKTINGYTSGDDITGLNPCTTYYVKLYTVSDGSPYCAGGLISTSSTCTTNGWDVSETLSHTTHASGASTACPATNYVATYTAETGYVLPASVSVSIGGAAKTQGTHYTWSVTSGTGTLTILAANITNSTGAISISITSNAAAYQFWYGDKGESWTATAFVSVGNNEHQITNFVMPAYEYEEGLGQMHWNVSGSGISSTNREFYAMTFAQTQSQCGDYQYYNDGDNKNSWIRGPAAGAKGTLRIYDNQADNGQCAFIPNEYILKFGSSEIPFVEDGSDANVWETAILSLSTLNGGSWTGSTTYRVGVGDASHNWVEVYNKCAATAVSSMGYKTASGNNWATGLNNISSARGKFRIWINNCTNGNWECHFVPYYRVTYDGSGASGSTTASADKSCEGNDSERTVVAAVNGFTVPTGKTFGGWASSPENAAAGTVAYAAGANIVLTQSITLYAIWTDIDYSVTVNQNPNVSATTTGQTTTAHYNTTINLTTTVPSGYRFDNWTTTDGFSITNPTSATTASFTMPNKNVTVTANFTQEATVVLSEAGNESTIPGARYAGGSYTLPSTAADCPDMGLYGWYKGSSYSDPTDAPTGANFYLPGATATLTGGENKFYAVYATVTPDAADTYTKITTTEELVTGDYLIVGTPSSTMYAMKNAYQTSESTMADESRTVTDNQISNPASTKAAFIWHFTKSTNTITIYSENSSKYFGFTSNHVALMDASQDLSYEVSGGKWAIYAGSDYLKYESYFKRGTSKVYDAFLFKRDPSIAGPYTTSPVCTTHELDVVADPIAGGTAEAVKTILGETKTTTATATPNEHYTFSHWTISGTGSSMSNTSEGKSTDNPVTVTMGTDDATLTAHFTEKAKCTVVFKNNGTQVSSNTYWLGENPEAPTLTDGTSHDACDATSDKHYGWTRNTITGSVADQATLDARTGLDVVYTKAATLPAITAGDDGLTLTYHAVWAKATGGGTAWVQATTVSVGDEVIIAEVDDGKKELSGFNTTITTANNYGTGTAFSTSPAGTIVWTVEAGSSTGQYSFKNGDDYYLNLGSSNAYLNGNTSKNSNSSWNVTESDSRAKITSASYSTRSIMYKTNGRFACYASKTQGEEDGSDHEHYYFVIFYKRTAGTVYSIFLTTCCDKSVELSDGTLSHCSISFSNANPQTCSSTDSERQVTITVTPDAGYEMTSEARLTFNKTSGTATAEYVNGPTGSGPYTFVYQFTKDDNGEGTFDATCTAKTYTITFDQSSATKAGTSSVDVVFNSALPAIPSLPEKTDYNFAGYYTTAEGGTQFVGSTGTWYTVTNWINSDKQWINASNKTLYPHWTEKSLQNYRTECPSFEVYNQDGTSAADIHLTSTKDVEIYASEAAGNLIRIIASGLDANGDHPKIGVEYYDANNGDALVTGTDRVFRLSNSSTYDYENDLLDLGENTTEYDQTFSICYVPKDYNQSHHYKLKLILRNNNTEKDNVTIDLYGRSLPKEFVIAAKSGDTWYALPNTLAATEGGQGAISPTAITVDNATTPTKVVNPVGTVIYGACNKYTNANRSGLRFTSDGAHWIQTSSTASAYKMWLSNSGGSNVQDWYLKSSDLSAYEVFMDPIGSPSDKRRIELYNSSGVKMGYHNTGATDARTGVGNVYLLPVEFPSITARIMEWGTDHVVVELRTPGSSTKVKTQIGGGAIGDEQSLESVKKDEGVYRLAVSLSSSDALKDLKLYFYNISDVLQGVAAFTIPRIVSSTTTTGSFGTPFKKDAPFVDLVILNGATLTVSETTDGTKFTFRDLYVYGNAKMVVPSGTYIDFSNVYLRGGHLDASWSYVYSHPQLVLNGTMGNTSNTINYDYLTNNAQFYSLALPYDVTLSTIVNPDFNNKQSWLIHAYDGALRASGSQVSGWYDVEEGSTEGDIDPLGSSDALTAGVGYTFFGAPQKVNSIRQKWSVNRFPMTLASGSAEVAKSGVSVTAHGMTESAGVYTLNDGVAPNDAGWNMLGNPFLADIGGTETYETAVKGTILSYHNVKTMDASGNWTGGWHWEENETNVRYVRIPNDLGTEYEQVRFKDATLRAFHHFFIQAGATGTFNFDLATRAQSMPQRIKRGKLLLPEEMDVDFRLSKGEASTKFGLTLCDDFSSDYVMNEDIAEDLSGEAMKAYTLILDQRVTYNGLPFTAAQQIIPVGFRAPNAGEYTFSYKEDENSENIEHIYLTDMRLGVVTDLKDNTYKFASEIGVVDNRFVLQIVFSSNVTTDVEETFEQENGRPLKFLYQGKIYILRNGILYDITGKRVREINK